MGRRKDKWSSRITEPKAVWLDARRTKQTNSALFRYGVECWLRDHPKPEVSRNSVVPQSQVAETQLNIHPNV